MADIVPLEQAEARERLRPLHWSELPNLPRLDPLIKRLFDMGGKSVIFGESNSGKT